jgi:uncharacterized protein
VTQAVVLPGLGITTAAVPDGAEIVVDVELEALSTGLVATGTIEVPWEGECRRCLQPVTGTAAASVREVFEPRPVDGETYPLADDLVDLEPMVRDAALLALPLAPLCGPDCLGPAPDTFPAVVAERAESAPGNDDEGDAEPPSDPRWAALGELRFDSSADDG